MDSAKNLDVKMKSSEKYHLYFSLHNTFLFCVGISSNFSLFSLAAFSYLSVCLSVQLTVSVN